MSTEAKTVTKYSQIAYIERTIDCYGGDSCEEHLPRWRAQFEGDRDSGDDNQPLTLKCENFPPGTIVTIEVPVCPKCEQDAEICAANDDCDFDWKQWAEDQYA